MPTKPKTNARKATTTIAPEAKRRKEGGESDTSTLSSPASAVAPLNTGKTDGDNTSEENDISSPLTDEEHGVPSTDEAGTTDSSSYPLSALAQVTRVGVSELYGAPIVRDVLSLPKWREMKVMNNDNKRPGSLEPVLLHAIVEWHHYERICEYERAKGEDFTLENLALITDTSPYRLQDGLIRRNGRNDAVRFTLVGVVTTDANIRGGVSTLVNGRRNLFIKPTQYSWGRASSVMGRLFNTDTIYGYMFANGLAFSSLLVSNKKKRDFPTAKRASASSSSAGPSSSVPHDEVVWTCNEMIHPTTQIPIRDARLHDFDLKKFQQLPLYPALGDISEGDVVMVVFTMGTYTKFDRTNLSLNIQEVVVLLDNSDLLDDEKDCDGFDPLPFKEFDL